MFLKYITLTGFNTLIFQNNSIHLFFTGLLLCYLVPWMYWTVFNSSFLLWFISSLYRCFMVHHLSTTDRVSDLLVKIYIDHLVSIGLNPTQRLKTKQKRLGKDSKREWIFYFNVQITSTHSSSAAYLCLGHGSGSLTRDALIFLSPATSSSLSMGTLKCSKQVKRQQPQSPRYFTKKDMPETPQLAGIQAAS